MTEAGVLHVVGPETKAYTIDAINRSVELAQELGYDLNHHTTNYAPIIVEMLIELRDLRKEKAERNKRPALKISDWGDR